MIELIKNSTIHGINHIYSSSNKIIKLFWIFLFLSGIIGITVNIVFVVIKYLSNPVLVSYTFNHEDFIWPDITFCIPTAPFNFDNSTAYDHWEQVLETSKSIVKNFPNESEFLNSLMGMDSKGFELAERTVAMSSADPQKLNVDDFGDRIIDIRITLLPFGQTFRLPNSPKKMFSTQIYQLPNNIPCHTFHIDKGGLTNTKYITTLEISLNFKYESYLLFNSSHYEKSVFLYLNNKNELLTNNPIKIYPGYTNTLTISHTRYYYNGEKTKCRYESYRVELYDSLLQSTNFFEGDFLFCLNVESQKIFVNYCNCYSPFLPIYKNETIFPRICLNATYFSREKLLTNANCMLGLVERITIHMLIPKCNQYYLTKCNLLSYKIATEKELINEIWTNESNVRRSQYIKRLYDKYFYSKKDEDYRSKLRNNMIELHIKKHPDKGDYYEEQYAYRFSDLLSDIGGLMGLWLGMSVVGLFEVFQLVYLYFLNICLKTQNVRQSRYFSEPVELTIDNKL